MDCANHEMETQVRVPPHEVRHPDLGKVTVYHGRAMRIGRIETNGNGRIAINVMMGAEELLEDGWDNAGEGIGLLFTPGPDEARTLAASLCRMADRLEAEAKAIGDDVLTRLKGARP